MKPYLALLLAVLVGYAPALCWALPPHVFFRRTVASGGPIEFVEAAGANFSATRSPTVSYPTATANDIWLAVFCATGSASYNGTPPSGWAFLNSVSGSINTETAAVFWKRATGGEGGTEAWTNIMAATETGRVIVLAYRNCKTTGSPINISATVSGGSVTAHNAPTVVTTVNNCMIVGILATDPQSDPVTYTWDGGINERIGNATTPTGQNGLDAGIYIGDQLQATAGSISLGGDFSVAEHAAKFTYALEPQ